MAHFYEIIFLHHYMDITEETASTYGYGSLIKKADF